jgi:hypothetical protein
MNDDDEYFEIELSPYQDLARDLGSHEAAIENILDQVGWGQKRRTFVRGWCLVERGSNEVEVFEVQTGRRSTIIDVSFEALRKDLEGNALNDAGFLNLISQNDQRRRAAAEAAQEPSTGQAGPGQVYDLKDIRAVNPAAPEDKPYRMLEPSSKKGRKRLKARLGAAVARAAGQLFKDLEAQHGKRKSEGLPEATSFVCTIVPIGRTPENENIVIAFVGPVDLKTKGVHWDGFVCPDEGMETLRHDLAEQAGAMHRGFTTWLTVRNN